jgi:hypothetical protein
LLGTPPQAPDAPDADQQGRPAADRRQGERIDQGIPLATLANSPANDPANSVDGGRDLDPAPLPCTATARSEIDPAGLGNRRDAIGQTPSIDKAIATARPAGRLDRSEAPEDSEHQQDGRETGTSRSFGQSTSF